VKWHQMAILMSLLPVTDLHPQPTRNALQYSWSVVGGDQWPSDRRCDLDWPLRLGISDLYIFVLHSATSAFSQSDRMMTYRYQITAGSPPCSEYTPPIKCSFCDGWEGLPRHRPHRYSAGNVISTRCSYVAVARHCKLILWLNSWIDP